MARAEVSTEAGYDKIRRFLTDCRQPNYMYNALDKIREGKKIKDGRTLNDLVFFATGMTICQSVMTENQTKSLARFL